MTDRELLELALAAKAAGIKGTWTDEYDGIHVDTSPLRNFVVWRPHASNGDALRLAVKLKISIEHPDPRDLGGGYVTASICDARHKYRPLKAYHFNEEFSGDPYAATRRAIVRAAAEIGKAML